MDQPESVTRILHPSAPTHQLIKLGICPRCLLRLAGETTPAVIRDCTTTLQNHQLLFPTARVANGHHTEVVVKTETNFSVKPESKIHLEAPCPCCLGLLQEHLCSPEFLQKIYNFAKENGFSMQTFWISLTLPNSLDVRQKAFDASWDRHSTESSSKTRNRLSVKDAWKAVVTPVLSSLFDVKWVGHDGLEINLNMEHSETEHECDPLKKKFPTAFQEKRGEDGKMKRLITRQALEKLLHRLHPDDLDELIPFPPPPITEMLKLSQMTCLPCSIFIAGRYRKYSRALSQTPWFIEEDYRKGDSSVEELICAQIKERFQCQSYRFMASGREDYDVRCLGDGRPFAVELLGAKVAVISIFDIMTLQDSINASTQDVEISDLQLVHRDCLSIIKTGEEEKTKTYLALCESNLDVTKDDLSKLNLSSALTIHQRTPVRVLHRRANAERLRIIHEMSAEEVLGNSRQFRLTLKTQAGTYIKEFVNGDFGRTSPSVTSLLGREVECEELDVLKVDLEWPPLRLS